MNKPLALAAIIALIVALGAAPAPVLAQPASAAPNTQQIEQTARNLFKALAAGDLAQVKELTVPHWARRLSKADIAMSPTGPKVTVKYDGQVRVMKADAKSAVVEAKFYQPDSTDTPAREIQNLRIFLVRAAAGWKADAPGRAQARPAPLGGWYHPGSFTFCPNRGIVFLPNHFTSTLTDPAVAQCR